MYSRVVKFAVFFAALCGLSLMSVGSASAAVEHCARTENKEGDFQEKVNGKCQGNFESLLEWIGWIKGRQVNATGLFCVQDALAKEVDHWEDELCKEANNVDIGNYALLDLGKGKGPKELELVGEEITVPFEGTSGEATLENEKETKVGCTAGKEKGAAETTTEGTVELVFTGCKLKEAKCKTAGAAEGEIKIAGSTTLVFDSLEPLGVAALLKLTETTFECTALVKITVKGTLLLLITPINSETTKFEFIVKQSKGKPTDNKYWEEGVEKTPSLLTSINGGAFVGAGVESAANKVTTSGMTKIEG
jgi:hypothetical protein